MVLLVLVGYMNGLIVLAVSMSFGDIRRLWKMTLSSNWLLWNEHNVEEISLRKGFIKDVAKSTKST